CFKVRPHGLPQRGKPDPRFTFKQESTKLIFQILNRVRKRWLRYATMTSSAGKMLNFGERHEIADMTHIHLVRPPNFNVAMERLWTPEDWRSILAVQARRSGNTRPQ